MSWRGGSTQNGLQLNFATEDRDDREMVIAIAKDDIQLDPSDPTQDGRLVKDVDSLKAELEKQAINIQVDRRIEKQQPEDNGKPRKDIENEILPTVQTIIDGQVIYLRGTGTEVEMITTNIGDPAPSLEEWPSQEKRS